MAGQAEMTITLRVHFSGDNAEERVDAVREAGKMAAKHWLTTALLVSDKRKPQVIMQGGDWITEQKDIELADDIVEGGPSGENEAS